jgi:hypothetical protein
MQLAVAVPRVQMFVWLMLRNHRGEPWQSGVQGTPALQSFRSAAASLDPRNAIVDVPAGVQSIVVHVPALELRWGARAGQYVDVSYAVADSAGVALAAQEPGAMGRDGWVAVAVHLPEGGPSYTVRVVIRDGSGVVVRRTLRLVSPSLLTQPGATRPGAEAARPRPTP